MDLTPFENLVKDKSGLVFNNEKSAILNSGIRSRMLKKGLESSVEYFNLLLHDQSEFYHLINLLTINETYFFREPAHYRLFSERLIPELLNRKKNREKIKILCAGCSTGEEPYSLVITLMEKYGLKVNDFFSVIAIDIDRDVIQKAKKGLFGKRSFRSMDDNLKRNYFEKIKESRSQYKVMESVRNKVEFINFNLLSDFSSERVQEIDIIFYRNVSIYFAPKTQNMVFKKLSQILNDKGYILVSSTETFFHNLGILHLIEVDGVYLYQKNIELKLEERRKESLKIKQPLVKKDIGKPEIKDHRVRVFTPELKSPLAPKQKKVAANKHFIDKRKNPNALFDNALHLAMDKRFKEALDYIDKFLVEKPSFLNAYTLKVSILINSQRMEEAKKLCLKTIEMEQWNLEGYLLLGLIAKIENEEEETIKRFKEALYIQSSCWLAHFYLAEAYHSLDRLELSSREYEITIKLLEKGGLTTPGLTYFPLSFSVKQIMHLCHHNLDKLRERFE